MEENLRQESFASAISSPRTPRESDDIIVKEKDGSGSDVGSTNECEVEEDDVVAEVVDTEDLAEDGVDLADDQEKDERISEAASETSVDNDAEQHEEHQVVTVGSEKDAGSPGIAYRRLIATIVTHLNPL